MIARGLIDDVKALSGVTVVDLTRYLPGPYCTRLLADLGAHVVKVESPPGDPMRGVSWYDLLNHGKQIVMLDLRDAASQDALRSLLSSADVCVEGFKPETARAIGVDGATLAARYPSLVHCSISGFGPHGPDVNRAAHDINYQGDAGLFAAWPPGRPPGLLIADMTGALHATIAILGALVRSPVASRLAGVTGATLEISLFEAAKSWTAFLPPPILRGEYACYNVYAASDGQWIALGALEAKFWERFCRSVNRFEWIELQSVREAQPDLIRAVRDLIRTRTGREWQLQLSDSDCCFSVAQQATVDNS